MTTTEEYELLLSSISHEIRNPVTLINSYLQLMATLHPQVLSYEQWQPIQSEMEYLRQLLSEISSFHNSSRITRRPVDMNRWLFEYASAAQMMIKSLADAQKTIAPTFDLHLTPNLPLVSIDPPKLRQVLDNLIRNAAEAISPPEHAGCTNAAGSLDTIALAAFQKGGALCITVSDTGCGIPSEYIGTLFEPFITYKPRGTGLGLAICRRIIDAHGGNISIISAPGVGTTFTVRLPVDGKE